MLEATQLIYYKVLFVIWQLITYYEDLLGFDVPTDLFDMDAELIHIGKRSLVHVELMADMDEEEYSDNQIKEILQEYMTIVLLPESEIPPYTDGNEIIESLYLYSVRHDTEKGSMNLDFLYIDNQDSYNLYKEDIKHERSN